MLSLILLGSIAAPAQASATALTDGWEYRWGDSPIADDGTPIWIRGGSNDTDWQAIDFPSNPPNATEVTMPGSASLYR
ncbi:hypothetical protein A8U91_00628 [Halomonas elongata]|uniref:Uncharacterized protein n=1 Tax=Halomonas elongata TaxID=2746 RepID=A0A1B8P207_HALEL|nr:hypothetical protein [Halomonas elongata]OBX36287.1 hypothetical protein A8U91_00628 [Halomonas elongata]